MTRGFIWTDRRLTLLRELRRQGLSIAETARAIGAGCCVDDVRLMTRELGPTRAVKPSSTPALATVPRPPVVPRPHLIDLSRAPSAMEQRFARTEKGR